MSLADWEALYDRQQGRCAICGAELDRTKSKDIHVDHNHETGKVRGLLCSACNRGLGFFKENPETLLDAFHYLDLAR